MYTVSLVSVVISKIRQHVLSHIEHKTDCLCELELDILLDDQGVGLDSKSIYYIYNGEFDPGSGRTLAAGLTHASRRRR